MEGERILNGAAAAAARKNYEDSVIEGGGLFIRELAIRLDKPTLDGLLS